LKSNTLLYQFKTSDVATKIIVLNVILFLLIRIIAFLFGLSASSLIGWIALPEDFFKLLLQPWSLVTYSFVHIGLWHLFFNMLVLYWFGSYVLNLFSEKRFLTIYLLGAIAGGVLYVLAYNIFPVFSGYSGKLIGASAAVRAIMIFIAAYTPHSKLRIFTFNISLWHIGVAVVLLDILQLTSANNPGGMLAHLGGALLGYMYAIQLKKGNDIGVWFENSITWVGQLFTPTKKKPFKKVYRTTQQKKSRSSKNLFETDKQKKIDALLDKIAKSGYDSLTKAEKEFLFKASKED
jgi:membrane associated rhomboid family serine protease